MGNSSDLKLLFISLKSTGEERDTSMKNESIIPAAGVNTKDLVKLIFSLILEYQNNLFENLDVVILFFILQIKPIAIVTR